MTEAIRLKIMKLRTELAFIMDDISMGGPEQDKRRREILKEIAELKAQ